MEKYNLEQTADENFSALLYEEIGNDKDKVKKNKKFKDKEGNVSCTCNII